MEVKKDIKMELPRPSEEEIEKIINQHIHHLVEWRKGSIRTPLGIVEGEDLYCHTCKEWLGVTTTIKFESKPKNVGAKAFWVGREPDDIDLIAKTYNLTDKGKELLKLKKEKPEIFKSITEEWKKENIRRDLKKLMKKHGVTRNTLIELLEEMKE